MKPSTFVKAVLTVLLLAPACSKEGEQAPPNSYQFTTATGQTASSTGGQSGLYQGAQPGVGGQWGSTAAGGEWGQASAVGGAGAASGAAGQSGTNPIGTVLSNPQLLQQIVTGALAGVAAQMSPMTGGELGPIEAGIKMKAAQVAKGMKPVGALMSARLTQGQHAQAPLQLEGGACYTIVGFGGSGIFRYQLNVLSVPVPGAQPQVVAQSADTASDPVVGGSEGCIKSMIPMAVTVDMFAVFGQGMVGAQVYKK